MSTVPSSLSTPSSPSSGSSGAVAATAVIAPVISKVRRPRLRVTVDGVVLNGAVSAQIVNHNYANADIWSISVALGVDPERRMVYWSDTDQIPVEIALMILPDGAPEGAGSWLSLVAGFADHVQADPVAGRLEARGRNYTAVLQDARTQEAFANQTSSDVAETLAKRHGFTTQVTRTTTLVGAYYQLEHSQVTDDNLTRQMTEWDLLSYLARQEGYSVWMEGKVLHFEPADPPDAVPVHIVYTPPDAPSTSPLLNASGLKLERDLQRSRGVQVTVKTAQADEGSALLRKYPTDAAADAQSFVITRPGLTADQALKLAQTAYQDIIRHERRIEIEMPGELSLTPRTLVALSGTGTAWDQTYWIDSIEREISFDGGFTQRITARNHSPQYDRTAP